MNNLLPIKSKIYSKGEMDYGQQNLSYGEWRNYLQQL